MILISYLITQMVNKEIIYTDVHSSIDKEPNKLHFFIFSFNHFPNKQGNKALGGKELLSFREYEKGKNTIKERGNNKRIGLTKTKDND